MICPYCGAENKEETTFCASCGFDMTAASATPAEPAPRTAERRAPVRRTAPASRRRRRKQVRTPFYRNRSFVIGAVGVLALVLSILLLTCIFSGGNGYRAYKDHILIDIVDGEVYILKDARKAKATGLEAKSIAQHQTSLDGSVVALLTDQAQLAVIRGRKLTVVAENVSSFVLSVDGTGLGYVTQNSTDDCCTLTLYNVKTKKAATVTDQHTQITFDLSPDGDSVAYYGKLTGRDTASLVFFNGKENSPVTDLDVTLMGLSNDGKYIYAIARDENGDRALYCYNSKGERTLLGPCNIKVAYFNEEHTQILYFQFLQSDGADAYQTSISVNGKGGNPVVSGDSIASPLTAQGCVNFTNGTCITVPADDLYGKVYLCQTDGSTEAWMVSEDISKNVLLASGISSATLSSDGKYVYYKDGNALKVLKISHGSSASEKATLLAENVIRYAVTSDCKTVYYQTGSDLYSADGKTGKNTACIASENVQPGIYINAKGTAYYMIGTDVYACSNGSKGKKILSQAGSLSGSVNGVVYIYRSDDSLYATDGAKQPKLILSAN